MVWRGAGILVLFLGLLGVGTSAAIVSLIGLDLNSDGDFFPALGLIIGAVYVFLFYKLVLQERETSRELTDENGQKIVLKTHDDFMFIPFRYWPYVMAAIGLLVLWVGVDA